MENKQLTNIQQQAISLLAVGENITNIAEKINVSRQTVSSWLNQSDLFQLALIEKQRELWELSLLKFQSLTTKAIEVLQNALNNDCLKTQLTASKIILSSVNISDILKAQSKPQEKELWRPLTEQEKEQQTILLKLAGLPYENLDNAMIKVKNV
jgi:DNA-binding MarR family transcriptional regulator